MHSSFLDFFIHCHRIILTDIVGNHQDLHRYGSCAQGNFNLVARLDLIACLHHTAIDADATIVASLIGNGTALDQAGDLQVLVQTHLT